MKAISFSQSPLIARLKKSRARHNSIYRPQLFYLHKEEDCERLETLMKRFPGIRMYDEIQGQLQELVRSLNPGLKFSISDLDARITSHLNGEPMGAYGVWVYYPWSGVLVHLLDKEEFVEVRTNRNQYKITRAEQDKLETLKIGVVGLSVGRSAAVTLATERGCGELRLADFDVLELNNYNRIQDATHNLGLLKVIATAREIAEIDPFVQVTCFSEGLTEGNLDKFFLEGGKLDMLVEECDSLDIKLLSRLKARELEIPVVMDTNDRGMVDVERFDLEPKRAIFHGLLDHLEVKPSQIKHLTNEEKIPFLVPLLGLESMSKRGKASILEVDQSINSWPQLASSVALGGAVVTDICRRIALGDFQESGRYYVDLEAIMTGYEKTGSKLKDRALPDALGTGVMANIACSSPPVEGSLHQPADEVIRSLIEAAILAPSGGNCQPWKWLRTNGRLLLFHDRSRSASFLDHNDSGSLIALGAAAENLVLKAHSLRLEVSMDLFPDKERSSLIATFDFSTTAGKNTQKHLYDDLVDFIPIRATNRRLSERVRLPREVFSSLESIVEAVPGAGLMFVKDNNRLSIAGDLVASADRLRLLNSISHADFINEIRWTKEESLITRDGIDLATIDLTPSEMVAMHLMKDRQAMQYLKKWGKGSGLEKLGKATIASASAVGLISMPGTSRRNFFEGGRMIQRVWLAATRLGIAFQPVTSLLFMLAKLEDGESGEMDPFMINELIRLRSKLEEIFPSYDPHRDIFLFRLAKAEPPKTVSLRRPVETVFVDLDSKATL